jgi:EAL and modified HD-GYP domain-containing signal transduction protein
MKRYYIARQPILDRQLNLYAYELLFRSSLDNSEAGVVDAEAATAEVLTIAADAGLKSLVGDRLAFVNLPLRFLADPDLLSLSPQQVVLEILEDVTISEEVIAGMRELGLRGYTLAMDDFVYDPQTEPALALSSLVKLDIQAIGRDDWAHYVGNLRSRGLKVLAEKVETEDEFRTLSDLGCDFFQGYFFARPRTLSGGTLSSNKISLLRLLSRINDDNIEVSDLADLVSHDVALSVRALNYVNSAAFALESRVESIRDEVIYLGRKTIRNWVTVYLMSSVEDKPNELMTMALVRARFCELCAQASDAADGGAYFTAGLFSMLDGLMDAPMASVLAELTLSEDMHAALLSRDGAKGAVLEAAVALELAERPPAPVGALDTATLGELYKQALSWSNDAMAEMGIG